MMTEENNRKNTVRFVTVPVSLEQEQGMIKTNRHQQYLQQLKEHEYTVTTLVKKKLNHFTNVCEK